MEVSEGLEGQIDDPRARQRQEMHDFIQYSVNMKHANKQEGSSAWTFAPTSMSDDMIRMKQFYYFL